MENFTPHNISALQGAWHLDVAHSWVGLSLRYAGVTKIQACFQNVEGSALFDEEGIGIINASIDANSFDARNPLLNEQAISQDFLWTEIFPYIQYHGTTDGNTLTGNMHLRGITQEVTFLIPEIRHVIDSAGEPRLGAEAHAEISRKAFGLTWNAPLRNGDTLIADTVELHVYASFTQSNVEQKHPGPASVLYRHNDPPLPTWHDMM